MTIDLATTPAPDITAMPMDMDSFGSERERMHRQMLSSVSHDLKTPLASIIGSLEIFERMKDRLTAEKQATLIGVALQEAYRLDTFITNILDMAKFDNGMIKAKKENVEISPLLRNCLLRMSNRLENCAIEIKNAEAMEIITDPVLLSRVVCLVLDNAVKYSGTAPVIFINYGKNADNTGYIHIHDNGAGIPESRLEIIFSKYTRFAKEDQQNAGTGLGLAICRSIMSLLGGTITASNLPAGGALFTLRFPLA